MSSSSQSTLSKIEDEIPKRPKRMRVKKYNVDVSNSINSIDTTGRIDYTQDSSTTESIDLSTINNIARIHLNSSSQAATSFGNNDGLVTPDRFSGNKPRMRVKKYNVDVSSIISTVDMAGRVDSSYDYSTRSGSVDLSTMSKNSRIHVASSSSSSSPEIDSKNDPAREGHSVEDSSKSSGSRDEPPIPPPPSSTGHSSTQTQHSLSSTSSSESSLGSSSSSSSLSSSASSSSLSSSDDSTSDSNSSIGYIGLEKSISNNTAAVSLIGSGHKSRNVPDSSSSSSSSSTSSMEPTSPVKYQYPSSVHRRETSGETTSEKSNDQDIESSHRSTISSKSTENSRKEQRIEPNAESRSGNEGHYDSHDNQTTNNNREQRKLYEKYHDIYHEQISEDEGENLEAEKSGVDRNAGQNMITKAVKNLEDRESGVKKNNQENEITRAIKNLKPRSKTTQGNVDNRIATTERKLRDSNKLDSNAKWVNDHSGSSQEAASINSQESAISIPRIDLMNGDDLMGREVVQKDVKNIRGFETTTAPHQSTSSDHASPPPLVEGNSEAKDTVKSSESVEMRRSMDRERRFQLWLERGVYLPASGSELPSGSSNSESGSSSVVSMKETAGKEQENSKKWWKRMGSCLPGWEAKATPVQDSSLLVSPEGGENDTEVNKKGESTVATVDFRESNAGASSATAKKTKIKAKGIAQIDDEKDRIPPVTRLESDDRVNESSVKQSSAKTVEGRGKEEEEAGKYLRTGGLSFADQVASFSRARVNKNSELKNAEDYDKLYQVKEEISSSGGSLADQIAAAARSRNDNNNSNVGGDNKIPREKNELKEADMSLADQIAAAARARKLKNQSVPMAKEGYGEMLVQERVVKNSERSKRSERSGRSEISEMSLADQVAAAANAVKLKNRSSLMTEKDYDKLYDPRKVQEKVKYSERSERSEMSLADQVAAAANAVKLKNRSSPMTEKDYDKLYDSMKVANSVDTSLADQVASAAMAIKLKKTKNKTTPMSEDEYHKLYVSKKERKAVDYGELYKKPQRFGEEPQRVTKLEAMDKEESTSLRKSLQNNSVNNPPINDGEDPQNTTSSYHVSDDKTGRQLNENPQTSSLSPSSTNPVSDDETIRESNKNKKFSSVSTSSTKPSFNNRKIGCRLFICCFSILLIIIIVILIGALLNYLIVGRDKNHRDKNTLGAPSDPVIERSPSPSRFPSLPAPFKPTTSVPLPQSPMPSFRQSSKPSASQPLTKPTLEPTFQQFFPTAAPISIPLTDPPPQNFIDVDKPITLPPSMIPTNIPLLPTEKPILPEVTDSPFNSPTKIPLVEDSSLLRQLLISRWPSLEKSLNMPSSPQSEAFEWLVGLDSEFYDYSERQLIQRFVMATFFFSTNGENWSNKEGWLSAESECGWYQTRQYREHCDASGNLLNLELNGNGLSGSLPLELALLSNSLTRLDLAKNTKAYDSNEAFLSGIIPSEIGFLTKLQYMSLRNQQMIGTLPIEVSKLSFLTVLDLENNNFEGSLMENIGDLEQLNNLYLGFNDLSGSISPDVGRLRFLVNLDLRGNRLSSSLPSDLGQLSYLQSLSLGNNNLTGTIPTFLGQLSNLRGGFDLSDNLLSGTIPTHLGKLSMLLTVLNLSSNELTGPIPTTIDRLVNLANLQLQNNLLTGRVPPSFNKLSQLQILQLQYNNLTGDVTELVCDALVRNKIVDDIVPTSMLTDCLFKVTCECCQYCCAEGSSCECQFSNTNQDFLCRHGDILAPKTRIVHGV